MSSLYLHIPFCLRKCHYCSFSSSVFPPAVQKSYVEAVKLELHSLATTNRVKPLSSLFIGGGTPTSLEPDSLVSLVNQCRVLFGFAGDIEISVEANPETVNGKYFEKLFQAGVNRLSLGVQSFVDDELTCIGRLHTGRQAVDACKAAISAGFKNINVDLMYGLPGQTTDSWLYSLKTAIALSPQHLSLYQLMVEEETPFGRRAEEGELQLPGEEEILEIDEMTLQICEKEKFLQYETSNYAKNGYACRHNINYWENNDYLAAGAAAVSFTGGVRQKRVTDVEEYICRIVGGTSPFMESECLEPPESFRETVIMGLRMIRGVSLEHLLVKYGLTPKEHYGSLLTSLMDMGMVEYTTTHLRITEKGRPLSNRIMAELV